MQQQSCTSGGLVVAKLWWLFRLPQDASQLVQTLFSILKLPRVEQFDDVKTKHENRNACLSLLSVVEL